jgi:EAL domain-containing protein (putative c-di-GMP-specific phosphodiesterase class I)
VASPSVADSQDRLEDFDRTLHEALVRQEFLLHYQPYLDLVSHQVAGVEALIRWQHPSRGLLYPDDFIAHAERSGLIDSIGEWVLRQACAQMSEWIALGIDIPSISVNVSPLQFSNSTLPTLVQTVLNEHALSARQLDLEITESTVPSDEKMMRANIAALRQLGVKISIDDFGMGYSSLERLRTIQVDRLKIDRVFVSELALNPMDACLIRSMIHLAQQLGLSVIAEGIEDAEACVRLQSMGCDQGQGFYFAAALGADACEKYLRDVRHGLRADPCRPGQSSEVYYPAQSLPKPR